MSSLYRVKDPLTLVVVHILRMYHVHLIGVYTPYECFKAWSTQNVSICIVFRPRSRGRVEVPSTFMRVDSKAYVV